ncbi:glycosyltransferase family 4 protein [Antarcticirhabdus aurantiaca]|uniref:Glycosyltransferase family 4 protein n=1 Tax=Antarcticirhabdus aurantiaca TaxID=2606717 RepID=A0ACD4NWR8_9HYPH|nr:glycosyltransferase family 4 protein [Antarcticirhabdus aurantiaca]WAJ31106.1 glycosyltransferase family 4 protein [Jeongeuplla avenae]
MTPGGNDVPADRRRIGYFLNTYPAPSGTFIRNEIEALEERGHVVERFAARRFAGSLVDGADQREAGRTTYLFQGDVAGLLKAGLREIVTNPLGIARATVAAGRLLLQARGGVARHGAYLLQGARLRQEATRRSVAHIHAHYSNNPAAVVMLCRALGGPTYSFTAHGPDEFAEPAAQGFGDKIGRAAFVVAITDYARGLLVRLASPDDGARVTVVRCGLDLPRFAPAPPVDADNRTLVCVGRLCPAKGQVHIPAAVAALKGRFPCLKVVLVGDGESRPAIEAEIARHGVTNEVVLHGWATNEDVRGFLREARALLLPSYAEGLPIVIMEAFALGRPVLSTTIAGIPELVDEECGWLVRPGDVSALTAAMAAVLEADPSDLQRMGREGRRRVELCHDRRRQAEALSRLFVDGLAHRAETASELARRAVRAS